ncbi:hypothetical protein Sango_0377500 [Sesamum angolense]|uniref:DUF4283 domain-containing protein n=1 Tax=Sesamum angolense TaxID=2727404 RepID=A0AAE1X9W9_9LAMI|nr:hypothetical protein Sango_0377500 [Sesamum angolense]
MSINLVAGGGDTASSGATVSRKERMEVGGRGGKKRRKMEGRGEEGKGRWKGWKRRWRWGEEEGKDVGKMEGEVEERRRKRVVEDGVKKRKWVGLSSGISLHLTGVSRQGDYPLIFGIGFALEFSMEFDLNLSLIEEEEEGLILPDQNWSKVSSGVRNELLLVGRLLSHRSVNFETLRNMLTSLLQPVKGVSIRRVSEDRFFLLFNHRLDKQRALEGRPWVFDKNLLILESVDEGTNLVDVCLDWSPFTAYVHDLPISFHNRNMAEHIGNKIGRYLDTELNEDGIN